jgi:hypothetical protein
MKYPLSLIAGLWLFLLPAAAQEKITLRIGAGYHLAAGSQHILDKVENVNGPGNTNTVTSSFGRGISFSADATWWLSPILGVSAGGSYLITTPQLKGIYQSYISIDASSGSDKTMRSGSTMAMAGIALKIPHTKLHPYARFGVLLPVSTQIRVDANWSNVTITGFTHGTYRQTFKLRNTAGYTASVGLAPALNKHLSLFAEINLQSLAILARSATLDSYTTNGVEQIGTYPIASRKTIYVKKQQFEPYDPNGPGKALTFSFPYSSIGANIGIDIKL